MHDNSNRRWLAFARGGLVWGNDRHGIAGLVQDESGFHFRRQYQLQDSNLGRFVQPGNSLIEATSSRQYVRDGRVKACLGQPRPDLD